MQPDLHELLIFARVVQDGSFTPYHSPSIGRIEVVRHGVVRRAKLYYIRDRVGKAAKIKERIVTK